MKGLVFDIQRFSLHDGPGIRTTVFLKGCSLNCFWCQNPEGLSGQPELMFTAGFCVGCGSCVSACPNGAHLLADGQHLIDREACTVCGRCVDACLPQALRLVGKEMTTGEVAAVVLEDVPYYRCSGGGVTLSGGEPLCQPDFAAGVLGACKTGGVHTALDTSLDAEWETIEPLLPHVDLMLIDLKTCDAATHREATGAGNERIVANYERLGARDVPVIVRVPVIPGLNDTEEDIAAIADLAARNANLQRIELLPHHRLGESKRDGLGLARPSERLPDIHPEKLRLLAAAASRLGLEARCLGAKFDGRAEPAPKAPPFGTDLPGALTPLSYERRLAAIRCRKLEHTAVKRKAGPRDVDDWGQIPLDGTEFHFTPETEHPKGYVLGPRDCGRNFHRFLRACPTYVDPMSSLLGGYYVTFNQYVSGWDPEAYWRHLVPEIDKYAIVDGIGNTQHFLSDVQIGLELGLGGLLAKIGKYRAVNTGEDQQAFYDGLEEFVRGVQDWVANHVDAARAMASDEQDATLRQDLAEMAKMNARLTTEPPRTFREAL